ncbi:MAG: hypothetical protein QOG41_125 [Thermoleophilaceae bacterium]|jgi:hypothetical protein|nr:hypothetical protein [Thermoleophilaceae bacterium]MEA2349334.1 hypothetical protein [Thermoleophilaceae bacterium]MEA2352224.1 hypothetical protein [Thermoleophilaceae bacterium]MEA2368334.1 hypothetical protein [Thermoleophilaceae bacterium]MEA2387352.1 hypothetical protein [Thermoleophilaceae bacterium]
MWPPIEIPPTPNVSTRLSPSQNTRPLSIGFTPRERRTMIAALSSPKIAPEAPTVVPTGCATRAPNEPAKSDAK